jgi:hypothetical protein
MPIMERSRLRIALVVDTLIPDAGGSSDHVQHLAAHLDELGHELLLVVGAGRPVLDTLTSGAFDVIHIHGPPWPLAPLSLLRERTTAAIVVTGHERSPPLPLDLDEADAREAFADIGERVEAIYARAIARRGVGARGVRATA